MAIDSDLASDRVDCWKQGVRNLASQDRNVPATVLVEDVDIPPLLGRDLRHVDHVGRAALDADLLDELASAADLPRAAVDRANMLGRRNLLA